MIRGFLVAFTIVVATAVCGGIVAVAAALGVPNKPGGIYDWSARAWARFLLAAAGVRIRLHGTEFMGAGEPRVFVSNHVSWYDVFALASELPKYRFVAKAELFRIPLFGAGARAVGTIPIERENRTSAFQSYEKAGQYIRDGNPVVVFPEGTRADSYSLRPFKKGPFVLAIASRVPIVPTIVYGAMEVLPRRSFRVRPGIVDIHFLAPVPTDGLTYADRDTLAAEVHSRMAAALNDIYDVESPVLKAGRVRPRAVASAEANLGATSA